MAIHCALSLRDESGVFHRYAYTMLLSCFTHTSQVLHVHLLCDETLDPFRSLFHELCERYGHTLTFHRVPQSDPKALGAVVPKFGPGALYRLFLPDLVMEDRVIYLDSDLIFTRDIADIAAVELGDAYCAAVPDRFLMTDRDRGRVAYFRRLDMCMERYCNTGVLLFNLARIRSRWGGSAFLLEQHLALVAKNGQAPLLYADQDVLNNLFGKEENSILYLDESFNYQLHGDGRHMATLDELAGKIVHFSGEKPLTAFYPAYLLFWKYYAQTPWGGDLFADLARSQRENAEMTLCRFVCTSPQTIRRLYDWQRLGLIGYIKKRLNLC